jgi:hypothetical protein
VRVSASAQPSNGRESRGCADGIGRPDGPPAFLPACVPIGEMASGNSSPTRAMSFAHAIREVSWEGGLSHESQQSAVASPHAACPPLLPMNGEGRATQGQSKPLDSLVPTPAAEHPEAAVGAAGRTPFPARPRGAGQRWLAAVVTYAVARPA